MIDSFALAIFWQAADEVDQPLVTELAAVIPRIYIIDRRERAEPLTAFADPRLHYAPFRQNVSLGTALNRALALAYEEQKTWLWVLDANRLMSPVQLIEWSTQAVAPIAHYRAEQANQPQRLRQRPLNAYLLAVSAARAIGGWNANLPSELVFSDFIRRLEKAGYTAQVGAQLANSSSLKNFGVLRLLRTLVILMQRQLRRK